MTSPQLIVFDRDGVLIDSEIVDRLISTSSVTHGKAAPEVFIYAAGWMRTPVAGCRVVEDSTHWACAACGAGMRVFGFTGGQHCGPRHRERLLEAGAELVFDDFLRLGALLSS